MNVSKKSKQASLLLPVLFALSSAAPVQAHHSLVGEFDPSIQFELRGEITEVEWTNPHIWIYMDVTDENGEVNQWQCEMGSPNQLFRLGWRRDDLPAGTIIRAQANPSREGTHICSTRTITLDDGTPVFTRTGNQ